MRKKKISHNEYRPRFRYFDASGRFPSKLFIGCELELEGNFQQDECWQPYVEYLINAYPWLYAKDEADLEDGCEINTHPFNWNWWTRNNGIMYVEDIKCSDILTATRRCGFHIHLSRSWFTRQHQIRMSKLFYANPEFLERISQRERAKDDKDWTLLRNAANPWIRGEILRCSTGEDLERVQNQDFNGPGLCADLVDGLYQERHVALNFCNPRTIEIRIFQSTLNPKLIQAYLEFAMACSMYTKRVRFQDVSISGLKSYVSQHRFPYLQTTRLLEHCNQFWNS